MNTVKRTKLRGRHIAWILILTLICTPTAAAIWMTHRRKSGIQTTGDAYYAGSFPLEGYFDYHQIDEKWAGNPLRETRDTMGFSGCLTCYIAAFLKGQGIYDYTPGQLNQLFSSHGVYDESSAIVWKNLEEAPPGVAVDLDGQMSGAFINRMIERGKCPAVKVRRKNGAIRWIMLTGTGGDSYDATATDPIDGYIHLSDYTNTIYSVHVATGGFY